MNKRWFVAGALGLLLAVFVLQAQARRQSEYLNPTMIGFVEQTSWFDRGIKVIIFEDGHGYAFQHHIPQNAAQDRGITIVRLQLAQAELDTLVQAFSRNGFLRLDEEMSSEVTDGTSVYMYFATSNRYHKVHNYMVPNAAVRNISTAVDQLIQPKLATGKPVTLPDMLADSRAQLQRLTPDSPMARCARDVLNLMVRGLLASNLVEKDRVADLMLQDKYW